MTQEEIFSKVSAILTEYLRLDEGEVKPESHIVDDIGADSLAMVEIGFKFSEAFGIGMLAPNDDNMVISNLVLQIEAEMKS
jgi:acyl carrier protein